MLFSSITFLFVFLPIVLAVYFLVPYRFKNLVMLIASLFFYAWGEPVYVILMILSICLNYVCGLDIAEKADDDRKKTKQSDFCGGCKPAASWLFQILRLFDGIRECSSSV